jgi:hypothetical protein
MVDDVFVDDAVFRQQQEYQFIGNAIATMMDPTLLLLLYRS